jgi:putative ABC transport system permease protein
MKHSQSRFPKFGDWLLNILARYDVNPHLRGDFDEEFSSIYATKGFVRAWFWYWTHLLRSLPVFIKDILYWRFIMFKNYLKIAFRNIEKHKGFSFINISGLALGIACFFLIMLYVQFEMSYDKFHKNSNRIYRAVPGLWNYVFTPPPLAPILREEYPEIESIARISRFGISRRDRILFLHKGKQILENDVFLADPEIFDVLTLDLIKGDSQTALSDPNSIIMTEAMAEKYFGNEDPMGKTLTYENTHAFQVTGIMKNYPKNSHLSINFIIPFENNRIVQGYDLTSWGWQYVHTFCLIHEKADIKAMEKRSNTILTKYRYNNEVNEHNKDDQIYFFPITKIYLHPPAGGGPYNFLCILALIAFFILIAACINYINLTTARSVNRAKEIGIRKVVGANRKQLVRQLLLESTVISVFAFCFSLIIIYMFLPVFNQLVDRNLSLDIMNNFQFIGLFFFLIVLVSIVSGSYPALFISSYKPVSTIKGNLRTSSKGKVLKNSLVIFQFGISIILIFCTFVVKNQLDFIQNRETGFTKNQIVNIVVRDKNVRKNFENITMELQKNPKIIAASASSHLPNGIGYSSNIWWPEKTEDEKSVHSNFGMTDFNFCSVYDIEIVRGRDFSKKELIDRNGAFLINESAAKELKWDNPLGKTIHCWGSAGRIVGIMKDFNFRSFYSEISPLAIFLNPNMQTESQAFNERNEYYISVKINGESIPETIGFLKQEMKSVSPDYPFEYFFFNDLFNMTYRRVERTGNIFSSFALISIFISCLGLVGLSAYLAVIRTKEIGIRKVLGAKSGNIFYILSKGFVKWILISTIFAFPIGWYFMNKWLQEFAYRIDLSVWIFLLSGLLVFCIALLTVSYQSIKAATANPADSLRYE